MPSPIEALELPFMRTALIELMLLAVAGGVLGAWIVLRRLAFYAHAAGTAAFPGLVVADAAGFSGQLAGLGVGLGYAGGVERARRRGAGPDAATGLLLAAALALGALLASDVLDVRAGVDTLLFGTLVGLSGADVWISALAAAVAVLAAATLGRSWTAAGFDPAGFRSLGAPASAVELSLLAVVALAVAASLPAVGALLVAAIFVVPAATARMFARSVGSLARWGVAVAALDGAVGLYVAYWLDAPPGPAVAVVASALYAIVAATRRRS